MKGKLSYIKRIVLLITGFVIFAAGIAAFTIWNTQNRNRSLVPNLSDIHDKSIIRVHSLQEKFSLNELCDESNLIVYGKVISLGSATDSPYNPDMVLTPVSIKVYKVYKGDTAMQTYAFAQPGGETSSKVYVDEDAAPLFVGDEVLLFTDFKSTPNRPMFFQSMAVEGKKVKITEQCSDRDAMSPTGQLPLEDFEALLQKEIG